MAIVTREDALRCCLNRKNVYRDTPFHDPNWEVARCRENKKIFAWIFERQGFVWINVKMDPEWRDFWRSAFPSVVPAYHLNKSHWSGIILDGTVPDQEIQRMVDESFDLVCPKKKGGGNSAFAQAVFSAVRQIPKGQVATYGQIAAMAGSPRAHRAVGSLLKNRPEAADCPCHRVLRGDGRLTSEAFFGAPGEQQRRLEAEGIAVKDGRVDLKKYSSLF